MRIAVAVVLFDVKETSPMDVTDSLAVLAVGVVERARVEDLDGAIVLDEGSLDRADAEVCVKEGESVEAHAI